MKFIKTLLEDQLDYDAVITSVSRTDSFPNGASLQGKIEVPYSILVKHFGDPDIHGEGEDGAVSWVIEMSTDDTNGDGQSADVIIYDDRLEQGDDFTQETTWRVATRFPGDYYIFLEQVLPNLK